MDKRDGTVRPPSTLGTQSLADVLPAHSSRVLLCGSIGPEPIVNPTVFRRAVRLAEAPLTKQEEYGRRG
jgi:hypothetical protein